MYHSNNYFKFIISLYYRVNKINSNCIRGLVQSPCGKINVIMTLGGEGLGP